MSTTTSTPYDWLRHIPRSLLELDNAPLFGSSHPFPWEELGHRLGEDLRLEQLSIEATDFQWRDQDQLFDNLGDNLIPLNLGISGLDGSLCWVMPRDDLHGLMAKLLEANHEEVIILENDFEDGFYRFLGYQVISTIGRINWDKNLSIHILNKKEMPAEASLCIDVRASWSDHSLTGRLILSPTFQKSWKARFAERTLELPGLKEKSIAEQLEVTVHLEVGRTSFTLNDWKRVKKGDFVLLESCSLKEEGKGKVNLTIQGIPFFLGKLKNGGIKILEHPEYREVDATMADEEEEEFEDFDEDFEMEEEEEELPEEEEHVEEEEEEKETEVKEEAPISTPIAKDETPPASVKDVPMSVVVEVGRIKISVNKLLELKPGNILDLNINPEDGVDLTVNGKRVAKGELLRLGDVLGVRILDIG